MKSWAMDTSLASIASGFCDIGCAPSGWGLWVNYSQSLACDQGSTSSLFYPSHKRTRRFPCTACAKSADS